MAETKKILWKDVPYVEGVIDDFEVQMAYGYKHTDLARELGIDIDDEGVIDFGDTYVDVETFIDIVDSQDFWDSTEMEVYDEAFEKLEFDYKEDEKYEDCDFDWIWDDFKKLALKTVIEELEAMSEEEFDAWFKLHTRGTIKDRDKFYYVLEVCGFKMLTLGIEGKGSSAYRVGADLEKLYKSI